MSAVAKGILITLLLASPLAWAGQPKEDKAESTRQDDERRVCKRTKQLGSNFTTRICKTQREWARLTEQSRSDLDAAASKNR